MTDFFNTLKFRFKQKDLLVQIIIVNVLVFLILSVVTLVTTLFKFSVPFYDSSFIEVSSNIDVLVKHPWTVLTYMFVHYNLWHILFNMLILYWFGQLFLSYFNQKQLGSLFILGGLAGALLFLIAFNTIPYYVDMNHPSMVGASAAVTAIIFASAFYNPQQRVNLLIFGSVKIIFIALFIFVLDFISLAGDNSGGHVAHIGGALIGYFFATQYRKGRDITRWLTRILDWVVNLFKPKPKLKVKTRKKTETDYEYNQRRNNESADIDRILDKIKASGYSSLNADEKKRLFDASQK